MRMKLWWKFDAGPFIERAIYQSMFLVALALFGWAAFVFWEHAGHYNPDFYEPKDAERGAYVEGMQRAREDEGRHWYTPQSPPADCAKSWAESFPVLKRVYEANPDPVDSGCRSGYRHWGQQFSRGGKR